MADRDRGAVVDDEVREDTQIAVGVGDARGARRAEPRHQFVAHGVDLGLGVLAIDRNPFRHRPAAEIHVVGGEMAVAEILPSRASAEARPSAA